MRVQSGNRVVGTAQAPKQYLGCREKIPWTRRLNFCHYQSRRCHPGRALIWILRAILILLAGLGVTSCWLGDIEYPYCLSGEVTGSDATQPFPLAISGHYTANLGVVSSQF